MTNQTEQITAGHQRAIDVAERMREAVQKRAISSSVDTSPINDTESIFAEDASFAEFDNPKETYFHSSNPHELVQVIAGDYGDDDRQRLANVATDVAISEVGAAYRTPIVRNAARHAAQLALGIKPLPATQEGEQ